MPTRRWLMGGQVQGVGMRPFVCRLAQRHALGGWVRNQRGMVEIVAHGPAPMLAAFEQALTRELPAPAKLEWLQTQDIESDVGGDFRILDSGREMHPAPYLPLDAGICGPCLTELCTPGNRRYRHPFIACAQCGPRYTLLQALPYDRLGTTMSAFPLCPACTQEYDNINDRRFHAETISCAVCGPALSWYVPANKAHVWGNEAALAAAATVLRAGGIIAMKGIGGYHLLCDARNAAAIDRLRRRKHRPDKPLAVLYPWEGADGTSVIRRDLLPTNADIELLHSAARPIVLIRRRLESRLATAIAPGLHEIGVMLPYSALHQLVADAMTGPLVATSANLSGEPLLFDNDRAHQVLHGVADGFLDHDRVILQPADDSVFRTVGGKPYPLRLGRGHAPLKTFLPFRLAQPILGLGAHLKTTITLAWEDCAVTSPHIGDMNGPRNLARLQHTIAAMQHLHGVTALHFICDAHPQSTLRRWLDETRQPYTTVFHHHAHASALAVEHGRAHQPTAIFTWDGLGYGEDGTLWGGETFVGRPGAWQRIGSFRPMRLPGGDRVAREPWRSAAALCWEHGLEWQLPVEGSALLRRAWEQGDNCHDSSAVGRLFDAAAALLGLISTSRFEGQAPMLLEAACETESGTAISLPLERDAHGVWRCNWSPLLPMLLDGDHNAAWRAASFHLTLAHTILDLARRLRGSHGITCIGLTGGVFQNQRLTGTTVTLLESDGFDVLLARKIPCNDAGISLGQVVEYAARSQEGHHG